MRRTRRVRSLGTLSSHNYIGHNCIDTFVGGTRSSHNYIGHDCIDTFVGGTLSSHNYIGHYCIDTFVGGTRSSHNNTGQNYIGTFVGDPIEYEALLEAYKGAEASLGSVKGNVGHANTAAGALGLAKAVACVHHGVLVPSGSFETPNPELAQHRGSLHIQTDVAPWTAKSRVAAVQSLGIGGTNAHVIIEQPPARRERRGSGSAERDGRSSSPGEAVDEDRGAGDGDRDEASRRRVLCLHGWRTSKRVMEMQLAFIRDGFGRSWLFDCVDAPHAARGPPTAEISEAFGGDGPYFEWYDEDSADGWEESATYVADLVRRTRYDAILGFSQGADLLTLVTALKQAGGDRWGPTLADCDWRCNILVCSYGEPSHPELRALLASAKLKLPSVHVVDTQDRIAPSSRRLSEYYEPGSRAIVENTEGHVLPRHASAVSRILAAVSASVPADVGRSSSSSGDGSAPMLAVSMPSQATASDHLRSVSRWILQHPDVPISDVAFTLLHRRPLLRYRVAYMVMAYIVMAYIVVAYKVTAANRCSGIGSP